MPSPHDVKLAQRLLLVLDGKASVGQDRMVECFKLHLKTHHDTPQYPIELGWVRSKLDELGVDTIMQVKSKDRQPLLLELIGRRTKHVWPDPCRTR